MQGAPRGAASPHVCDTFPTSCNVNNKPFIQLLSPGRTGRTLDWGIAAPWEHSPSLSEVVGELGAQKGGAWSRGWRGSLVEPSAEVCRQDAKEASGREITWPGPGVRERGRRPGSCWVRGE